MLSCQLTMPDGRSPSGVIVAVHGLMESSACLQRALSRWGAEGLAVLAVNLRGHGDSPRWTEAQLAAHPGDVMVDDLLKVIGSHEIRQKITDLPIIFYGHSAGGGIAGAVAARGVGGLFPTVAGVLLEDPFWRLPVTRYQDRAAAENAYDTLVSAKSLPPAERFLRKSREWPDWDAEEVHSVIEAQMAVDEHLVRNGNVIPTQPWPEVLEQLAIVGAPVLIVTGTDRIGMGPEHQSVARSLGARVQVIAGASHFVRRDCPEQFMELALAFFSSCIPRRRRSDSEDAGLKAGTC